MWDAQNRLVQVVNPFAETTTLVYDALDRELKKTLGNGMSGSHVYDAAGRETLRGNNTRSKHRLMETTCGAAHSD